MSWGHPSELPREISRTSYKTLQSVQIDGVALLKIVKHCEDGLPGSVTGALLGIDVDSSERSLAMHITSAFPLSRGRDDTGREVDDDRDEERSDRERMEYLRTMAMLKEVNADCNLVGWYRTMQLGHFTESGGDFGASRGLHRTLFGIPPALAEELAENSNRVLILYDPVQTAMGNLTVRAYKQVTDDLEGVLSFQEMFEELPVTIRNPGIISAFLFDMQASSKVKSDFNRLDLSFQPFLEKNMGLMIDEVERMTLQVDRWRKNISFKRGTKDRQAYRGRGRHDDEDGSIEPSRADTVLTSTQIGGYCQQINQFTSKGFTKLFLAGSLHKDAN